MKVKIKRCLKWSFVAGLFFIVIGLLVRGGEGHRHYVAGRTRAGFMPHENLHHSFGYSGFHMLGLFLSLLFFGIVIVALLTFIRNRKGKCGFRRLSTESLLVESWSQPTTTAYGEFLDQWEKNLLKNEGGKGGNGNSITN